MAYWNSQKQVVVHVPTEPHPINPGWEIVDCSCCGGLEWGGDYPRECSACQGMGHYCRHIESGALALYPGGPFVGRDSHKVGGV